MGIWSLTQINLVYEIVKQISNVILKLKNFSAEKNQVDDRSPILQFILICFIQEAIKQSTTCLLPVFLNFHFPNIKWFVFLDLETWVSTGKNSPEKMCSAIFTLDVNERAFLASLEKNMPVTNFLKIWKVGDSLKTGLDPAQTNIAAIRNGMNLCFIASIVELDIIHYLSFPRLKYWLLSWISSLWSTSFHNKLFLSIYLSRFIILCVLFTCFLSSLAVQLYVSLIAALRWHSSLF